MGYITSDPVDVESALGNLSSALDVVSSIGKQIEQKHKELERWEEQLKALEKELAKREEELKVKENEYQQKCEVPTEPEAVEENEDDQKKVGDEEEGLRGEPRGALRDCKFSTKIILNVGM